MWLDLFEAQPSVIPEQWKLGHSGLVGSNCCSNAMLWHAPENNSRHVLMMHCTLVYNITTVQYKKLFQFYGSVYINVG